MTDQNTCSRCGGPVHRDYCVNPHCRIAELEDQVETLTAQLEEAERMIVRWRERIERAPKATAFVRQDGRLQVFPPPWKSRSTGEHIRVAIVRLDGIGLEPASADSGTAGEPGK